MFGLAFLTGCGNLYTVTLNDNVLYSPNPAVREFLLADANLQGCLNQALVSGGDGDPTKVTLLACPAAGVESLAGIQILSSLEQLDLSDNDISNLAPLASLRQLRILSIRNNDIRNIGPLMSLPLLRFVALQGNDSISCRQLNNLAEKIGNSLNRPQSCN